MNASTRNPSNWEEYQYGTSHRGSVSSAGGRSVRFSGHDRDASPSAESSHQRRRESDEGQDNSGNLRRRRSSVAMRLNALAHVGGVNSIENFARSWQRAAGFPEIVPHPRPSFIISAEDEDASPYARRLDIESGRPGLLRTQLENSPPADEGVIEDTEEEEDLEGMTPRPLETAEAHKYQLHPELGSMRSQSSRRSQSIFAIAPHLATPLAGSYGTSYGTLGLTLDGPSMAQAGVLWQQQQQAAKADLEREPLLVKEVEQDGKIVLVVAGQSTLPQTVFNSTNVLIGVGLLSLPLALKYSGWICGMVFLLFAALVTQYTAKLLAKCMDVDGSLITFADLAFISYGQKARIATSVLFVMELLAACVALFILFADTLHLMYPGVSRNEFKVLCGILLVPLNFAPLRVLSFTSVAGILSCFLIVSMIFFDGFMKPQAPGSLREPATTYIFPANWLTLPLSFGLLMSPWGGHGVFPNIYRDMRHPHKYPKALKMTFSFTYLLDAATAVAGLLMFGDNVMDEITSNILETKGYPKGSAVIISLLIAIIPLTKLPLNARPIVSTIEVFTGLNARVVSDSTSLVGMTAWTRGLLKIIIRVGVAIIFVIISMVFPSFDSIMSFMGSALCNLVCIILPLMFHLKIFGKEIATKERVLNYFLIAFSSILAIVGTVFAFLPKSMIGAE